MKDLFFSESEKIAFWVAGYTDTSFFVENIIKMLTEQTKIFSEKIGVEAETVKTDFITSSRSYKSMRVFYAENISTKPEGAFVISSKNGWTMQTWLQK